MQYVALGLAAHVRSSFKIHEFFLLNELTYYSSFRYILSYQLKLATAYYLLRSNLIILCKNRITIFRSNQHGVSKVTPEIITTF
jgi:hypothetical protein